MGPRLHQTQEDQGRPGHADPPVLGAPGRRDIGRCHPAGASTRPTGFASCGTRSVPAARWSSSAMHSSPEATTVRPRRRACGPIPVHGPHETKRVIEAIIACLSGGDCRTISGFSIATAGQVMEPAARQSAEVEGVLNPAAARGPDGHLYLFPRLVGRGNFSRHRYRPRVSSTERAIRQAWNGWASPSSPKHLTSGGPMAAAAAKIRASRSSSRCSAT